jgi:hypothetical protein
MDAEFPSPNPSFMKQIPCPRFTLKNLLFFPTSGQNDQASPITFEMPQNKILILVEADFTEGLWIYFSGPG